MKYALMVYQEENSKWQNGDIYKPKYTNIGDYIQSLAAKQFLPRVDKFIDREQIKHYDGDPVKMIMNGWWRIYEGNESVSPKITPLYISYHIAVKEEITQATLDDLKKYEPIGCRDMQTCDFLNENGVKSYFSACLTLTLGKTYKIGDNQRTNEIIFADYEFETFNIFEKILNKKKRRLNKIDKIVKSLISKDAYTNIVRLKHSLLLRNESNEKRFEIAENYIHRFAKAKLVVTSRIHCALPCLALGTPVLLYFKNYDATRYEKLIDLLNYVGIQENKIIYKYDIRRQKDKCFLINSQSFNFYSQNLIKRVEEFIE